EKFTYAHWPDCCYLLTADGDAAADRKLKAFGPLTSEEGFLQHAESTRVLVHASTQRVVGVRVGNGDDCYLLQSVIGSAELCEQLRGQEASASCSLL
ncbi:TAGLN3, partial [Symbiodinium necroappetens]